MDKALAPAFARTTYNGVTGIHHAITPLNISGSPIGGADPAVILKDSSTALASTVMTDFWTAVRPLMSTGQQIGLCEIYTVDADTGEGTFIYGFDVDLVGTSVGVPTAMSQLVLSFKLTNGRSYKLVLMDTPTAVNTKDYAPFLEGGVVDLIVQYITGETSPVYGRGNAYPFAPIAYTSKTNDALRKRQGLG